ncbi:hypothetical protein PRIC1_006095 [Phytophthora ramorum]
MPAKLPLLTSAHIVTSFCMPDGELPHVMLRLNDFLDDFSADCTIVDAYRRTSSLGFMQYVAAREDPQEMNPFYRRWLFNAATEMAASRGDLASLRWLVESYLPSEFLTKAWLLCNYAEKLDGCEFEVPTSDWRFNDWCAMINLHRARQYDASTWWVCESAALHLDRQQA